MELTPRQADIILLIRNHKHLHGYAPSIREMCRSLGICRGTMMMHIERLEKKGKLRRKPKAHRTLEVVGDSQETLVPQRELTKLEKVQARLDELRRTA